MENLNFIVGKNLQILRKKNKLTQAELAERFSYSDKAVSKWEKGESLPPIEVFYRLAKFYEVSLDSIVGEEKIKSREIEKADIRKRYLYITLLSVLAVWLIALLILVFLHIFTQKYYFMSFAWAVPVSLVVGIVFDSVWNKSKTLFLLVSGLVWSTLLCLAIQLLHFNIWEILLIGIPLQIAIFLWAKMVKNK